MAYKALYRTYRPSTFEEVAGQQHIIKTLKNALATGKIAHAYLFAGPRGTGKTTMAKLLAKALNCDEGYGHQCNQCKNCQAINEGTHPDVLEIDAASNNGVEEIRDIIDKVKYGTILGKYKVYIIDEVHMMTASAFNALLKTLEEPPEHAIFILATTEPHKILPTILSRCQRYDFSKVNNEDVKERIKVVLSKENIEYNDEAIDLIISLADGGMRDALSILDQVIAYSGNKLNTEDILDIFALESKDEKMSLISSIAIGDTNDVLSRLSTYISKGTDIKRLTNDMLLILKDVLIFQTSRNTKYLELLSPDEVCILARQIKNKKVIEMIDILMETLKDFKKVNAIVPLFQVTLLKLASLNCSTPIEEEQETSYQYQQAQRTVINQAKVDATPFKEEAKPIKETSKEVSTEEVQMSLFSEPEPPKTIEISKDTLVLKGVEGDSVFSINDDLMVKIMVTATKDTKTNLIDNWKKINDLITHPDLGRAAALLADGRPLVASKKVLILEYQLKSMAEKINAKEIQKNLQDVLLNSFGNKMFVFAVNRNDSIKFQKQYMDLLQLGKLPKAKEIVLEFEGE